MGNLFRRLALLATALLLAPAPADAQGDGTPQAATRSYFAALKAADWPAAAGYMHPEALDQFRSAMGILARMDTTGAAARQVLGLRSAAQLDSLASGQVFAHFLENMTRTSPEMAETLREMVVEPTAEAVEDEGVTRVDYQLRITQEDPPVSSSVRLKQHEGAWRLLLTSDVETMVRALEAQGQAVRTP